MKSAHTRLVECALAAATPCVLPQRGRNEFDFTTFDTEADCFHGLFKFKAHYTTGHRFFPL